VDAGKRVATGPGEVRRPDFAALCPKRYLVLPARPSPKLDDPVADKFDRCLDNESEGHKYDLGAGSSCGPAGRGSFAINPSSLGEGGHLDFRSRRSLPSLADRARLRGQLSG
jgi:hypothetical protein